MGSRWFGDDKKRRIGAVLLIIILLLISLFPREYRAAVTMTPADPQSLGLASTLGQLGATSSAFGNQAAIEIGLKVGRSVDVRRIVIRRLQLVKREGFSDEMQADRWLQKEVDIRSLRGGILQIEVIGQDQDFGLALTGAYAAAIRERLAEISRQQTAYKRSVLVNLVGEATDRLARAQSAYDNFRRVSRYAEPGPALGSIGGRIPALQQELKSKEVALEAARAFATDDNMSVRQILIEISVLKGQLAEAENLNVNEPYSVNRVVVQSTQVMKLQRELNIAQSLYDSYKRFLEGTAVEDLASTGNVRIIEPPYIDSTRQFRAPPAALALLVFLMALLAEVYLIRPPVGAPRHGTSDL